MRAENTDLEIRALKACVKPACTAFVVALIFMLLLRGAHLFGHTFQEDFGLPIGIAVIHGVFAWKRARRQTQ